MGVDLVGCLGFFRVFSVVGSMNPPADMCLKAAVSGLAGLSNVQRCPGGKTRS